MAEIKPRGVCHLDSGEQMDPKITRSPQRLLTRLAVLWKKRFGVLPIKQSIADMSLWFASPLGQTLLVQEQAAIDDALQCVFGYHLLQLGISGHLELSAESRISHRFTLHQIPSAGSTHIGALADFNHLPLASESIDAVILHHVLDYSQSPHHLLREAARVVIPRGHLLVVGFNPWSLWGCCASVMRFFTAKPRWRFQYLRKGRLLDWLTLVDMEAIAVYQGFYCPPVAQSGTIKYLQWLERWGKRLRLPWGGFYLIVARKDHVCLTPIKPAWQQYRPLRGLAVTRFLGRSLDNRLRTSLVSIRSPIAAPADHVPVR
jgi:SAM-dependent methyltransferase